MSNAADILREKIDQNANLLLSLSIARASQLEALNAIAVRMELLQQQIETDRQRLALLISPP